MFTEPSIREITFRVGYGLYPGTLADTGTPENDVLIEEQRVNGGYIKRADALASITVFYSHFTRYAERLQFIGATMPSIINIH